MEPVNDSPPLRSTILGSFLRGRPRNSSQSHFINTDIRELSPSPPQPPSPNGLVIGGHRRSRLPPPQPSTVQSSTSNQATPTTTPTTGLGLSHMLRRRRSAGTIATPIAQAAPAMPPPTNTLAPVAATPVTVSTSAPTPPPRSTSTSHRIRLVPHLDSRRSLRFDAISRELKEGDPALRIGRFTDRSGLGLAAVNALGSNKLAFKSKVVSRAHAEIWVESGGRFFIKDTKSSSGTFLNHVRLSAANTESRPYPMKDGDILQLGVDYQGGAEDIYKSVKIRIEVGREWQAAPNAFNTNALKNLRALAVVPSKTANGVTAKSAGAPGGNKSQIPDCCICLFGVAIRQALFIAPCSHTFHYKCIRPLLESHHPAFSCPLCRTFADLEEDVELDAEDDEGESATGDPEEGGPGVPGANAGSRPVSGIPRDVGAETEVECSGLGVPSELRMAGNRRTVVAHPHMTGEDLTEEEQFLQSLREVRDEEMLDVGDRDSDGDLVGDPAGHAGGPNGAGGDSEGSGSGEGGRGESPALGEMGVDSDGNGMDDGTVGHGSKRKR